MYDYFYQSSLQNCLFLCLRLTNPVAAHHLWCVISTCILFVRILFQPKSPRSRLDVRRTSARMGGREYIVSALVGGRSLGKFAGRTRKSLTGLRCCMDSSRKTDAQSRSQKVGYPFSIFYRVSRPLHNSRPPPRPPPYPPLPR